MKLAYLVWQRTPNGLNLFAADKSVSNVLYLVTDSPDSGLGGWSGVVQPASFTEIPQRIISKQTAV